MGFERLRHNPLSDMEPASPLLASAVEESRAKLADILEAVEPFDTERRRLVELFEQLVEDNARVREIADEASKGASESKWLARVSLGVAIASLVVAVLSWVCPTF